MSMMIVTEDGELWSLAEFCRSQYVKPVLPSAFDTEDWTAHEEARGWATYVRIDETPWCISIELDGRVSFLTSLDESKKADHFVDSRYNTRAGVVALGRLLGGLLETLRQVGSKSVHEVSFDPESPAFGMVFRHMAKNTEVLEAFEREGLYLCDFSEEVIRFRRYPQRHEDVTEVPRV
jgi:hypothetical protein